MKSSVVIATRNRGRQLDRCLWSILENATVNSNRVPEEIIVCDDGPSSDNTSEVVRRWADIFRDIQISYIVNKRDGDWRGPAIPRNRAVRMTNPEHEVLILLEPEMLLMPDTVQRLMEHFENPRFEISDPDKPWLPAQKSPERFFLTASMIGYDNSWGGTISDRHWQNPAHLFGHSEVQRRWPEINTRVAAILRKDLFEIGGWDEAMVNWGYDDTDSINRLQTIGVNHIPLRLPVVHMWHEPAPANGTVAEPNLQRMQMHANAGKTFVNDERWGLLRDRPKFPTVISEETWQEIQRDEALSWNEKAWPSKDGKMYRERKYLAAAAHDLEIFSGAADHAFSKTWADWGCGPLSILELFPDGHSPTLLAFDPLHSEYEKLGVRSSKVKYAYGKAEDLAGKEAFDVITSVNGIDHYQDPRKALANMKSALRGGGRIFLHFCVNNASEGHPHPAHAIDLTNADIEKWAAELGLKVLFSKSVFYGWRHQAAAAIGLEK